MRLAFSPLVRAWLGAAAFVAAWAETRIDAYAANWYRGLARALLGWSAETDNEQLARGQRFVRIEVALLAAAGATLLLSAVASLLL